MLDKLEDALCKLTDSEFEKYLELLEIYYDRDTFPSNRLDREDQVNYLINNYELIDLIDTYNLYVYEYS